jgi:ferredoxin
MDRRVLFLRFHSVCEFLDKQFLEGYNLNEWCNPKVIFSNVNPNCTPFNKETNMTYIITSLCLRDSGCVEVCPVECIVPGKPKEEWPLFYIDPDTCIDCGACVPECPYEAIFPEDEVPDDYVARDGDRLNGTSSSGFSESYEGSNHHGATVALNFTKALEEGESVDLTVDIQPQYDFFDGGPGYDAAEGGPDEYES